MTSDPLFFLAACQYPGGIFDRSRPPSLNPASPANVPGPADRSLQRLIQVHRLQKHQRQLVITGDNIYVDATAGLFDASTTDVPLQAAYDRRAFNPWWKGEVSRHLDVISLIDDHEIEDNWEPSNNTERNRALRATMETARAVFISKLREGKHPTGPDGDADLPLWQRGELASHMLFVGDTRTERSARDPAGLAAARIMSRSQFLSLCRALAEDQSANPGRHKFVATPSMLLPRRLSTVEDPCNAAAALRSDAWDGYPGSLRALLAYIADHRIENCVFLSGDEHIGCVAEVSVCRADVADLVPVKLWSVHAGALYAPYPFANAVKEDFAESETFDFKLADDAGQRMSYSCCVKTWFPPVGDGFVGIGIVPDGNAKPALRVTYYDAGRPECDWTWPEPSSAARSGTSSSA